MLESLLERLKSQDKATLKPALEEARALPPEQLLELLNLVEKANPPRLERKAYRPIGAMFLLFCGLLLMCFSARPHTSPYLPLLIVGALLAFLSVGLFGRDSWQLFRLSRLYTRPHVPIFLLLEGVQDPRFLGHFLNWMADYASDFHAEEPPLQLTPAIGFKSIPEMPLLQKMRLKSLHRFTEILNSMLMQAEPEHLAGLTSQQRRALLLPLNIPYFDLELTFRILKALEQIGDNDALPVVERLARKEFYLFGTDETPSPEKEQVRQVARKCLPHIHRNLKEAAQSASLLRPSASQATPETLLRPATPTADVPTAQLLRPIDHETREETD